MSGHVPVKTISLKGHPQYSERWVQDEISKDLAILGLGEVFVKSYEKRQPSGGRLDLLLENEDGDRRYEVEIQLGATDESHIIRAIEYWDIERRRNPKYEHTAVIVAEDITSRFLNVVSLFNGHIPLMALKLSAIENADGIGLLFTKVLDTVSFDDNDDDSGVDETDRTWWETVKGTPATLKLADSIFAIAKEINPKVELSYNSQYIGFWIDGKPCNFASLIPKKSVLRLKIRFPRSDELIADLEGKDIGFRIYGRDREYAFQLQEKHIATHREDLKKLLKQAYDNFMS